MRTTYRVTFQDGTETEAVARPADIVQFERQYGVAWPECFADEDNPAPMEWVYYLAWAPLARAGHRDARGSFDEFMLLLDDVAGVSERPPVVPFDQAPTGSESASLPTEAASPSESS